MQDNLNDKASRVDAIIERIGRQPDMLVPVLQAAQEEFKYLSKDVMALIAKGLNVPAAKVYGVATFLCALHTRTQRQTHHPMLRWDCLSRQRLDGHHGRFACRSRACRKPTHHKDGNFTLEIVSCLGACGLAPVVVLDEHVHGQCNSKEAVEIIKAVAQEN